MWSLEAKSSMISWRLFTNMSSYILETLKRELQWRIINWQLCSLVRACVVVSNQFWLTPFLVFGLGTLLDLTVSPYSPEADNYFDLGVSALNLHPLFSSPETGTVQTLLLMAIYLSLGGRRFTMEGAYSMVLLASKLGQSVRHYCWTLLILTDILVVQIGLRTFMNRLCSASIWKPSRPWKPAMEVGPKNCRSTPKVVLGVVHVRRVPSMPKHLRVSPYSADYSE